MVWNSIFVICLYYQLILELLLRVRILSNKYLTVSTYIKRVDTRIGKVFQSNQFYSKINLITLSKFFSLKLFFNLTLEKIIIFRSNELKGN